MFHFCPRSYGNTQRLRSTPSGLAFIRPQLSPLVIIKYSPKRCSFSLQGASVGGGEVGWASIWLAGTLNGNTVLIAATADKLILSLSSRDLQLTVAVIAYPDFQPAVHDLAAARLPYRVRTTLIRRQPGT